MSNIERKERIDFDYENVNNVIVKLLNGKRPTHGEAENALYSLQNLRGFAEEVKDIVLTEADARLANRILHGVA